MPFAQRLATALLTTACCYLSGSTTPADAADMQRWMARDGKLLVDAELVDYSDDELRLKQADGETITVAYRVMKNAQAADARTAKASYFRAGDHFRVQNVMEGLPWKVRGVEEFKDEKVYSVQTTEPVEKHGIAVALARLKIPVEVPAEKQGPVAKALTDQIKAPIEVAVESWEFEQRQREDGPHYGAYGVLNRQDGKQVGLTSEVIYRGKISYLLQVFTIDKDKAQRTALLEGVVGSLEEL